MSFGPDSSRDPEGAVPAESSDQAVSERDEGTTAEPQAPEPAAPAQAARVESPNMLPARETRRSGLERILVRLIATAGIVGIGVAIGAIMVHSKSQGWLVGLVVALVSVALSAILWSSRQL